MGLVGTEPARDRVLLAGDAAGLVNPLQGEGIAQAMDSGRAAAEAILGGVDRAAGDYRAHLARAHGAYLSTAASAHRSLLRRPKLVAPFTRGLTAPAVGRPLAGAWSITWNDLLDGAPRGRATAAATVVAGLGRVLTARSADRRWIRRARRGAPAPVAPAAGVAGSSTREASAASSASSAWSASAGSSAGGGRLGRKMITTSAAHATTPAPTRVASSMPLEKPARGVREHRAGYAAESLSDLEGGADRRAGGVGCRRRQWQRIDVAVVPRGEQAAEHGDAQRAAGLPGRVVHRGADAGTLAGAPIP